MARGLVIMSDFDDILELETPHGFLVAQGKETAIARIEPLDIEQSYLIVSNGEAFGVAEFEQPAQIKTKEFDDEEWQSQHRITQRERRQWWGDSDNFYVYRLKSWEPFEGIKLYEDGKVIDEPRLTAEQWKIVSAAKELPKQIIVVDEAIGVTAQKTFIFDKAINPQFVENVLKAAYDLEYVVNEKVIDEHIPLYSLALVRNPRMRVSKKSPEAVIEVEQKQEGEDMPFGIVTRDDEFCVVNTDTEEVMGCHETEEDAESQLTALRINVEAEEGDAGMDKPKKRKPRKKDIDDTFAQKLKKAAKNLLDMITLAETKEKEVKANILSSNYGITQKKVNGELWHFAWSTNAFEDREKEIFSTKSLEQYVEQATEKGDRGFFNLWHIPNTDFARKEWQGVVGRFLVEAGPYLDNDHGQSAKEFFREFGGGHPELAPEGWGCSPEFRYLPEERATGVYENIWITRTSTLPKMAAANVWTQTRQLARSKMALSEDQIKAAIEVFKDEDFVKSLIQEGEQKTADLEAAGVAHKGESEKEQPESQQINMDDLAAEVGKQFSANLTPIAEALETLATEIKEIKEWRAKQEKEQSVRDKTESPRFVFEMKRASESNDTVVTEDDGLKDKKPVETQRLSNDPWEQMGFNRK